jgi:hypothetical protein
VAKKSRKTSRTVAIGIKRLAAAALKARRLKKRIDAAVARGAGRKTVEQMLLKQRQPTKAELIEVNEALRQGNIDLNDQVKRLTANPFQWLTSDGRELRPSEMEEEHLRNTVCYLQRRLVSSFGVTRFLDTTAANVEALHQMFVECKRRGFRV